MSEVDVVASALQSLDCLAVRFPREPLVGRSLHQATLSIDPGAVAVGEPEPIILWSVDQRPSGRTLLRGAVARVLVLILHAVAHGCRADGGAQGSEAQD